MHAFCHSYSEGMAIAVDAHRLNIAAAQQSPHVFKVRTAYTLAHTLAYTFVANCTDALNVTA